MPCVGQTASGFLTRSNKDRRLGRRVHWGNGQVGKKNGKESQNQGQRTQNRGKRKRKLRERREVAREKEGAPRIYNEGRGRGQLCNQKNAARAPVCSANSASISWEGLKGREATSSARRTVLNRSGGTLGASRLLDYGCPRGHREKLGVLEGQGRRFLPRLRVSQDRMTGVNRRNQDPGSGETGSIEF